MRLFYFLQRLICLKNGLFFCFFLLLSQCLSSPSHQTWKKNSTQIKVLSTTGIINDLIQNIGQDRIDTLALIQGDLDPHSYQMVKGDDEKLQGADLIFYNGLGLEHGTGLLLHLREKQSSYCLGDYLKKTHPEAILYCDGHPDPHVWMDIKLWSETIPLIVSALSEKDPSNASFYQQRGEEVKKNLLDADNQIRQLLALVPPEKRYLVSSHDAFHYFTRAYLATSQEVSSNLWKIRCQAPEGLSPESQLSTRDIQRIIEHLQKYDIHTIFSESNVNQDSIRKIAQAASKKNFSVSIAPCALFADAMGPPDSSGDTYINMLLHNAHQIAKYLNDSSSNATGS